MKVISILGALLLVACGGSVAQDPAELGFNSVLAEDVHWVQDADFPGLSRATLAGDPSEPGLYVIRVRFGPGVMSSPHLHDQDRHVVVVSGTWGMGIGDSFDCANTQPMPAGAYAMHPAGAMHFDGSCNGEEVVVQIVGMGPVLTTRPSL